MDAMIEAQSPQDGAYDQQDARSKQQRARQEQPESELANINAAILHLQKEQQRLIAWKEKLHGKDGIKVAGECITLDPAERGAEEAAPPIFYEVNIIINGAARVVAVAVQTTPTNP